MPSWARYTGAIYFGLMMSGALAPPDWGVASATPPAMSPSGGQAKTLYDKPQAELPVKPTPTPPRDPAPRAPRADPPLPAGPDLLR